MDDDLIDGDQEFEIRLEITSSDEAYDAMVLDPFKSTNLYVDVHVSSGELRAFLHPGWRNLRVCVPCLEEKPEVAPIAPYLINMKVAMRACTSQPTLIP